jgi:hypothetical protein
MEIRYGLLVGVLAVLTGCAAVRYAPVTGTADASAKAKFDADITACEDERAAVGAANLFGGVLGGVAILAVKGPGYGDERTCMQNRGWRVVESGGWSHDDAPPRPDPRTR